MICVYSSETEEYHKCMEEMNSVWNQGTRTGAKRFYRVAGDPMANFDATWTCMGRTSWKGGGGLGQYRGAEGSQEMLLAADPVFILG